MSLSAHDRIQNNIYLFLMKSHYLEPCEDQRNGLRSQGSEIMLMVSIAHFLINDETSIPFFLWASFTNKTKIQINDIACPVGLNV